jgi:aryl-alcohol dehydrogenase-like predicted oxidoreductase
MMATRPLGRTGASVSILGLGGAHLAEAGSEAIRIAHEAIDHGLTFMDNAWEYGEGEAEEIMGRALVGKRDQVFLMTRSARTARART